MNIDHTPLADPHASSPKEMAPRDQSQIDTQTGTSDTSCMNLPDPSNASSSTRSPAGSLIVSPSRFSASGSSSGIRSTATAHRDYLRGVSQELLDQFARAPLLVAHYDTLVWHLWVRFDGPTAAALQIELKGKTELARKVTNGNWPIVSITGRTFQVMSMAKAYWAQMATKEASQYATVLNDALSGLHVLVNKNLDKRQDQSPTLIFRADSSTIQRFGDMVALEDYILTIANTISSKRVDACRLSSVHFAVDILGMPVANFSRMSTLMAIQSAARKAIVHLKPQAQTFSGFSVGDSTNHRVQFYNKIEELSDKGRKAEDIESITCRLAGLWETTSSDVCRIEFQFKDFLKSNELDSMKLKVESARDWQRNFADLMTYFTTKKLILSEDETMVSPHPVWRVISDLWIKMGLGMVYRQPNPMATAGLQVVPTNSGSSAGTIPVQAVTNPPPSRPPRTKKDKYIADAQGMIGRFRNFCSRQGIPEDDHETRGKIMDKLSRGQIPEYGSWEPQTL